MSKLIGLLASKIAVCLVEQLRVGELSLEVLNYQLGDTLIVKIKDILSEARYEHMEKILLSAFPDTKILILENGTDIAILRKEGE